MDVSQESVKVIVNVRPLIASELLQGRKDCVTVVPGQPQVQIGAHCFTFDHVYGSSASPSNCIFEDCVAPLVEAIFSGYNATVLAYGQTGSGKTYTMGTNLNGDSNSSGIIPLVIERIFRKAGEMKKDAEFLIRVSFIEIFKEEIYDLLKTHGNNLRINNNPLHLKPSRVPIQIRQTLDGGGITLVDVIEAEVTSKEEMSLYLMQGSQARATGSNNMNSQSSRSHAIFTIYLQQKRCAECNRDGPVNNNVGGDILVAKLHLVDLAGSERAKRTGAIGLQLKEGIHINKGLLALGNVINALGDKKKRKDGGHVPFRDSKLTVLLQDSLGGNSKTVMIACISPVDTNAKETINTLKYAHRAKNIQNKPVINRDPASIEMQKLRGQLEQLQSEHIYCRDNNNFFEQLQVLHKRFSLLEVSNTELHQELKECQITCEKLRKDALDAQAMTKQIDQMSVLLESNQKQIDDLQGKYDCQAQQFADLSKKLEARVAPRKVVTKRRSREKNIDAKEKNIVTTKYGQICCHCSRYSSCKTKKCECHVVGKSCNSDCFCDSFKCANKEVFCLNLDDEKSMEMTSRGSLLLQSAFGEKHNKHDSRLQKRKPLCDIGNVQVNPKEAKKNRAESTIQLWPNQLNSRHHTQMKLQVNPKEAK